MCRAIAITSLWVDQKERSCCSTISEAKTGTFISLIGTYIDGVPAGGTGCDVKCLHLKGEDIKSCCASWLAKQTSKTDTSAQGTTPTAELGMLVTIFIAQSCLYVDGRGMKAE